jgi:cytochrome P450
MIDRDAEYNISNQLLAGNETSSTSLSWMIARLIEHPEVQERLQAEITHVSDHAASAGRNVLSNEEISRMTYLEGFIVRSLLQIEARCFRFGLY